MWDRDSSSSDFTTAWNNETLKTTQLYMLWSQTRNFLSINSLLKFLASQVLPCKEQGALES